MNVIGEGGDNINNINRYVGSQERELEGGGRLIMWDRKGNKELLSHDIHIYISLSLSLSVHISI